KYSTISSWIPVSAAHAIAAPALTAPMRSGSSPSRCAAADQKPSCQKQRHPPPAKTTASKGEDDTSRQPTVSGGRRELRFPRPEGCRTGDRPAGDDPDPPRAGRRSGLAE